MTPLKQEILEILSEDSRILPADMAVMLGVSEEEVCRSIQEMENNGVIVKYETRINRNKVSESLVQAIIEVNVVPQRSNGFDDMAKRLYRFPR